jgi:OTU domain-containing protein 6
VNPDGHCLFSAVADQLALRAIIPPEKANYAAIRLTASHYMLSHPDDFLPFLPSETTGLMSSVEFERYCVSIRDTSTWGGEPEILALTRAYGIPIHVVQGGSPPIVIHKPSGPPREEDIRNPDALRISYHRKMYGLGEVCALTVFSKR